MLQFRLVMSINTGIFTSLDLPEVKVQMRNRKIGQRICLKENTSIMSIRKERHLWSLCLYLKKDNMNKSPTWIALVLPLQRRKQMLQIIILSLQLFNNHLLHPPPAWISNNISPTGTNYIFLPGISYISSTGISDIPPIWTSYTPTETRKPPPIKQF